MEPEDLFVVGHGISSCIMDYISRCVSIIQGCLTGGGSVCFTRLGCLTQPVKVSVLGRRIQLTQSLGQSPIWMPDFIPGLIARVLLKRYRHSTKPVSDRSKMLSEIRRRRKW